MGIYLPLYDYLVAELQQRQVGVTAPLWAGTLARTASVFCTAPLELVRTRLQAAHLLTDGSAAARSSPVSAARGLLQQLPSAASGAGSTGASGSSRLRQVGSLWTGVGATLARDVPFSALYWGMVEPIRQGLWATRSHGTGKATEVEVLAVNVTGEL